MRVPHVYLAPEECICMHVNIKHLPRILLYSKETEGNFTHFRTMFISEGFLVMTGENYKIIIIQNKLLTRCRYEDIKLLVKYVEDIFQSSLYACVVQNDTTRY